MSSIFTVVRPFSVLFIQEALDFAALHHLFGDDLPGVLGLHLDVEGLLGQNLDDGALSQKPKQPVLTI